MSRAPHDAIDGLEAERLGNHPYPPQSVRNQQSQVVPGFVDGSGPILSIYLDMVAEEDVRTAESWKADADRVFLFTSLFSAVLASLIIVSMEDMRANSQDTVTFYLSMIYQTLADPNSSNIRPSSPPSFSPPAYAIWVNSLWFMSLVISLTCAVLANLLQQWARRYIEVSQSHDGLLQKRACIRNFYAEGVQVLRLPWVVEALPAMLHLSVFLFFAGLIAFLFNFNFVVFTLVLAWFGLCITIYGYITILPIFRHYSPYHTPLTSSVWSIVTGIQYLIFRLITHVHGEGVSRHFSGLEERYRKRFMQGLRKTADETALNSSLVLDTRAFLRTFDSMEKDDDLERFFAGLPGFRGSRLVSDPLLSLTYGQKQKFLQAVIGLLDRTFLSDLLPETVKRRRAVICLKAIDPANTFEALRWILARMLSVGQYGGLQTAEIGHIVRGWGDSGNEGTDVLVRAIVSGVVARAQERDDRWFILASSELGISESVLRDYAAHGDSLSLAILIHIIRQQLSLLGNLRWPAGEFSKVLETASKFKVQDTSPELQHNFCALWNRMVLKAKNDQLIAPNILRPIRNIYAALHQGTNASQPPPTKFTTLGNYQGRIQHQSSPYHLCSIPGHHPNLKPHIHDVSAPINCPCDQACDDPHDNSAPARSTGPDSPLPNLAPVERHIPLDNEISASVIGSFHPAHQTTIESHYDLPTSSDPTTACGTQGGFSTSTRMMPQSTPETSTSASPLASSSPPSVVTLQHDGDLQAYSDVPDIPPTPSPIPFLDSIHATDPPSSPDHPMTVSDHVPLPESHSPVLATAATRAYLSRPTSAPAAAEGEGSTKVVLRKDSDEGVLDPLFAAHTLAGAEASPDHQPHLLPMPPVTALSIAGPSPPSIDAQKSEDLQGCISIPPLP